MSNLSPDFVLPEKKNFCANPQRGVDHSARFYTDQNAFEHEERLRQKLDLRRSQRTGECQ